MPYWEFWDFVRAAKREEFCSFLRQLNVNNIPNMDDITKKRFMDDNLGIEKPETEEAWTAGLRGFLQAL
jgi:hypothetical protein